MYMSCALVIFNAQRGCSNSGDRKTNYTVCTRVAEFARMKWSWYISMPQQPGILISPSERCVNGTVPRLHLVRVIEFNTNALDSSSGTVIFQSLEWWQCTISMSHIAYRARLDHAWSSTWVNSNEITSTSDSTWLRRVIAGPGRHCPHVVAVTSVHPHHDVWGMHCTCTQ